MAKVVITTPVFKGDTVKPRGRVETPNVVCYYRKASWPAWTKVNIGEEFEVPDEKTIQIKCVVPYREEQNYKPYDKMKIFHGGEEVITPEFEACEPIKVTLHDGDTPVNLCTFYKNGKVIDRDYTDYGEDNQKPWERTFKEPKPAGYTWTGFKDGDYFLVWKSEKAFQLIGSANKKQYGKVIVDIIPEELDTLTVDVQTDFPDVNGPFVFVTPVQSAQADKPTKGKTFRSEWKEQDGVIYVAPKEDAFAAFIDCGPTKQYTGYTSNLKFECEGVTHIDPNTTMHAVGQIISRAAHKFVLPEKGAEGTITITSKDGVTATIKVVKELP